MKYYYSVPIVFLRKPGITSLDIETSEVRQKLMLKFTPPLRPVAEELPRRCGFFISISCGYRCLLFPITETIIKYISITTRYQDESTVKTIGICQESERGRKMAPPTIMVHKTPDPCGLFSPNPFSARLKMVGNIIELKRPTARIVHIATRPTDKLETITRTIAQEAKTDNTNAGFNILVK